MRQEGQIIDYPVLDPSEDLNAIILRLLDVAGVVDDHLDQTGQRDFL